MAKEPKRPKGQKANRPTGQQAKRPKRPEQFQQIKDLLSKYKVQTDQLYEKGPKRPAQAI
jgi:hypothetical protein